MSKQGEYTAKWKRENKDKIAEYNRRRYEENKQALLQQMAVWRSQNKEKIKVYNQKKRQEDDILYVPLKEPKFIYKIILSNRILNFKKNN
jgi:hypothetical protein